MEMIVTPPGYARWGAREMPCAVGAGGIGRGKREGDLRTPAGRYPLQCVLYRADRLAAPACRLPTAAIARDDGWCCAPADPRYNRPVRLPCTAEAEALWRDDGCYDLLAVIGYNDAPVRAGFGSAIFLHAASSGWAPTEGCVALALADLQAVLAAWRPEDAIVIRPPEAVGRTPPSLA